ncbi:MAG: hypothetical protein ACP5F1_00085 [Thermoplasmata archaeon]
MENYLTKIIENFTGVGKLPSENEIKVNISSIDEKIKSVLNMNCSNSNFILSLINDLRKMEDILTLRKRIDSSISTLIYFIYTIAGSAVGISLGMGVFFTTTGNFGHILLLLSILGSVISIAIGIKSISDERKYLEFLINNVKGMV